MAEVASAYVSLMPSAKGFGGKISSQIGSDLDKAGHDGGKRMGRGLSGGFLPPIRGLMGPVAALFAVGAMVGFFKSAHAEARESQKVNALTANVIKTTGGVAKITAGQVGDLAMAISNKTGVDDEAIQHGANLLLTFKNIHNEVGKGSDIFNRATAAAVDLSASGFGDVAGSSKMLGKALNDPIKGITALGRAGVTFSAGQKKQIEGFVKVGDLLSAQKIIMKEVESQVGGSAAASATAGEKLATTWGNFKETIGTALLPAIDSVMGKVSEFLGFLLTNVGPAIGKAAGFFSPLIEAVKVFFSFLGGNDTGVDGPFRAMAVAGQAVRKVFDDIIGGAKVFFSFLAGNDTGVDGPFRSMAVAGELVRKVVLDLWEGLKVFFSFLGGNDTGVDGPFREMAVAGESARGVIATLVAFFQTQLIPAFQQAAAFIMTQVVPAFMGIVTAVQGYVTVLLPIVQAFIAGMIARFQPMLPTIMAIFATIGQIIVAAMGLIQAVIERVTTVISFIWTTWGGSIMSFISGVWAKILVVIQAALTIIQGIIKTATSIIKGDWSGAWNGIKQILSGVWDAIKGIISLALNIIGGLISGAWALIKAGVSAAWGGIKTAISAAWDGIKSAIAAKIGDVITSISGAWDKIKAGIGAAWGAIKSAISAAWDGIKSAVTTKAGELVTFVKGVPGKIVSALGNLGSLLTAAGTSIIAGFLGGLTAKFEEVKTFVGGIATWISDHKGPVSYDRTLLTPHGNAIMDGFHDGLKAGFERVKAYVSGMADAVAAKLKTAVDNLAQLKSTAASLSSSVAGQVIGTGNFTGIEDKTFEGIIASLTEAKTEAGQFASVMARLQTAGLDQTTISQLIAAGPASLAAAQSLLESGKTGIAQINALQAGIAKSAFALGKTAANDLYATGIAVAQGLVKGLRSQEAALEAQMKRLAALMVQTTKKALDSHSPSRVYYAIGQTVPAGLIGGVDSGAADVAASMRNLVSLPRVGSLDFASSADRASAVAGAGGSGATSADIAALGDRIGAELERQARTIQTMQRQMAK